MSSSAFVIFTIGLGLFAQEPARDLRIESTAKLLALLIGNQSYSKWPLKNPASDAQAMNQALRAAGFETDLVLNVGLRHFEQAVNRFVARIRPGDTALFYYAGHGIQLAGENYLIPIDFDAKDEADAKYVSYSASRVQERMEQAGARLSILVLDACRNNPFRNTRSRAGGLAAMSTGKGTLIAFATAPGQTADDNPDGSNGLFTSHLIAALGEPGLSLDQIFNRVRERVYTDSGQRQLPWTVSSVIGEFYFRPTRLLSQAGVQNPLARPRTSGNPLARQNATDPVENPPRRSDPPDGVRVVADPNATAAGSRRAYDRGDFEEAMRLASEALRQAPANKEAWFVLAAAQYRTQNFEFFEGTVRQALAAGVTLPIALAHHHTLTGVHRASLTISGGKIAFDPIDTRQCNQKAFEVPLSNLIDVRQQTNNQGEIFLNLRVRDTENKVRTLNFADPEATVDSSAGLPRVISPAKAQRELATLASVLTKLAR